MRLVHAAPAVTIPIAFHLPCGLAVVQSGERGHVRIVTNALDHFLSADFVMEETRGTLPLAGKKVERNI